MSLPARAAAVTCAEVLIDAAIISVGISYIAKISAISLIRAIPSSPMSSSLPTNGET